MPKNPRTSMDSLFEEAERDYSRRAKSISSTTRSVNEIGKNSQKHINNLSQDVSSLSRRQRAIEQQLQDIDDRRGPASRDAKEASSSILRNVNLAMITLAAGMKKITTTTAGALKDAVGDYGRAISEDFSINKQNLTAMALSRITPVFGYFVSKFMQTDVYRRAVERLKSSLSSVFHGIGSLFHRGGGGGEADIERVTKKFPRRPRKMQAGGYIAKGGLAQVHAAEVIMPIDTVLDRIDRRGGSLEIQQEMLTSLQDLNIHMRTFSDSYRKDVMHRKGLMGDFFRSLISGEYGRSWEMQMLFLQKEIRNAIVDQSKNARERMEEAMEVTMRRHPLFRNIMRWTNWTVKFAKWLTITVPIKTPVKIFRWAFGRRDKYQSALGQALSGDSPLERMTSLLSLIYTAMAPNLERMNAYLWSIGRNTYLVTNRLMPGLAVEPKYGVDTWSRVGRFMGTMADRMGQVGAAYGAAKGAISDIMQKRLEAARKGVSVTDMVKVGGTWMTKAEKMGLEASQKQKALAEPEKEKKKGIVSQTKELIKIRQASQKTATHTENLVGRLKKFGSDLVFYMGLGFNMISSVLNLIPGFGTLMRGIGGIGGLAKSMGSGIWSIGKYVLGSIVGPLISSLGSWITGLLASVGFTGLAATLGTSIGGLAAGGISGIGTIAIGVIAAGLIGYGIGWVINKGLDWIFGEEGSIGSWVYDKLNPVIEGKRESIVDMAWNQMQEWGDMVVGYIVWPFQKMYELTKAGIGWIWEQVQKIPGVSTVIEWAQKAYGAGKDFLTKPYFEGGETGNLEADVSRLRPSRAEQAKQYLAGKKREAIDAATYAEAFGSYYYKQGLADLSLKYQQAQDPETRKAIWSKIVALKNEYETTTKNKIEELKAKGLDMTKEQRAAIDAELAANQQLIDQMKESAKSVGERVSEGAASVKQTVVNTTNRVVNSPNVNNNYSSPSESRFAFGSGDRHAASVLQCDVQ